MSLCPTCAAQREAESHACYRCQTEFTGLLWVERSAQRRLLLCQQALAAGKIALARQHARQAVSLYSTHETRRALHLTEWLISISGARGSYATHS